MTIKAVEQAIIHGRRVMGNSSSRLLKHEWSTRYFLIDPVIRALGWKTESPRELEIELPLKGGRLDYVLSDRNGNRVIIIEAKALRSLNVKLRGRQTPHEGQLAKYIRGMKMKEGYGVLTDGREWHIFDTSMQGRGLRSKHRATVNISDGRPRDPAKVLFQELGRKWWWSKRLS